MREGERGSEGRKDEEREKEQERKGMTLTRNEIFFSQ